MAKLEQAFDSNEYEDNNSGFDVVPVGEYTAQVIESDFKNTADKTGKYTEFRFKILEGKFSGSSVWTRMNIKNKNPKAESIARSSLAELCRACGQEGQVQDTDVLHGIPVKIKVKVKSATAKYAESNDISGFKPLNGKSTGNPAKADGETSGKPSWAKPKEQ